MLEPVVKGLTFGLLLSIAVGPVMFSIIKQSINNGHKGGLAFVLGVSASDITLVLISNIFTGIFDSLQLHKTEVGIIGSVFLISVGIFFIFFKKIKVDEEGNQLMSFSKGHYIKIFLAGYFMNILNPGVIIFWLTATTATIFHSVNNRIIIFVTCLLFVLATDILKVMLAGKIRKKLTPHNIHIINRISGMLLIVFGAALIWGVLKFGDRI
ncbi:MAG TPA: LysE family transporter [Chitinophagaceae bacterium]|jgi:threonine/homoserine/homoserine lactone efflux protein|nr:LysE family transporter [Chitinophagaceae bacterium]HMU58319.1 LysE family transporter [Chitinophagaceae bacterium]